MWIKSLTTKIFLTFASIALLSLVLFTYVFSRANLRESETYVFENMSARLQLDAAKLRELIPEQSPEAAARNLSLSLLQDDGLFLHAEDDAENLFAADDLKALLPQNGTSVTTCKSQSAIAYYCAFSFVGETKLWIFQALPQTSVWVVFWKNLREILAAAILIFILTIVATFAFSVWLLRPVRRFSKAARLVSQGQYQAMQLPLERSDEIGELAHAFDKMVADLREREHSLAHSAVKLAHSERLATIGQMGAGIAHEVKNPITSMMGYARILANKTTDPVLKESAEIILKESERCNQILQQMLRFARNDPQEKKPYVITDVLTSTLLLAKAEADRRHIKINLENDIPEAVSIGSAQQIQQVLLNLILNALQASPEGSQVFLRAVQDGQEFVVIEVEDHGSGIPEALQSKIFNPFFTTKPKGEGTGLGLSVAQEIVAGQNGHLAFESHEGKGTKFALRLPQSLSGDFARQSSAPAPIV